MSGKPATISPRLRSREPAVRTPDAAAPLPPDVPPLRVLLRVPEIEKPAEPTSRLAIAKLLLDKVPKKYAALGLAIVVVCTALLAVRHRTHKPAPADDYESEAPLWTGAASAPTAPSDATGPMLHSAAGPAENWNATPWSPGGTTPSAQTAPANAGRPNSPDMNAWQPPAGSNPGADTTTQNRLPASVYSPANDHVPEMPVRNPSYAGAADRNEGWRTQPAPPAIEYRTAQHDTPGIAAGHTSQDLGQPGVARFDGYIARPPEDTSRDGFPQLPR